MLILRRIWHLHWLNRHTALTTQVRRTWSRSGHEEVDAGAGEPEHRVIQEVLHHHEGQDLGGQGGKRGLRPLMVLHSQVTRPWQGKDCCLKTNFWKRHHFFNNIGFYRRSIHCNVSWFSDQWLTPDVGSSCTQYYKAPLKHIIVHRLQLNHCPGNQGGLE